jgi:hypothetical protein
MRTACQKSLLYQMPHEYRYQANQGNADEKENGRVQSSEPEGDQDLQYGPMNDIYAIREVPVLREVSEITPEAEHENHPGYPHDVEDATREKMVNKKQTCRDKGNGQEVALQPVEVE